MKKKMLFTMPIIAVLIICMVTSVLFMRKKPDSSHINKAQKIAEYTKPAVVRILNYAVVTWTFRNYNDYEVVNYFRNIQNRSIVGGSGSGAIINSNGYVVTNAHVVEVSKLSNQEIADLAFDEICLDVAKQFGVTEKDARTYLLKYTTYDKVDKYLKVMLPGGSTADGKNTFDGEIKTYGAPVGEGKDVAVVKIEGKNLPTLKIGQSDKVQLQDSILVFGFPGAADSDLLSPDSSLVVTVTDGKVSAVDKKSAQGAPVLQISAPATHGNSGGPVIKEDGTIVGLLTFRGNTVNGQEVQGFNFVVPSDTIKEFIAQSGAVNEPGEVDRLYKEGLELYWGGYYKDALKKFEGVQRLYPGHSEIKKFISECQQKSSISKILWSNYKTLFLGFDGFCILVIIGLLLFTFINKPKVQIENNNEWL